MSTIRLSDVWDAARPISRRRFLQTTAAGAVAAAIGPSLWRQAYAAGPALDAHLAYGADAARQMTVSWRTAGSADPGQVARVLLDGEPVATAVVDTRTVARVDGLYHHAAFEGLEPGTTYAYEIGDANGTQFASTLTTAPAGAQSFTFTALGDQGTDEVKAGGVNAAVVDQDPALHFHVGDLCYAYRFGVGSQDPAFKDVLNRSADMDTFAIDHHHWDEWLALISNPTGDAARGGAHRIPWMTTIGNHEMEPSYGPYGYRGVTARLALPGNGTSTGDSRDDVTYTFDHGNVRFIALDGNDANHEIPGNQGYLGDAQTAWLESVLADANRPDSGIDFIVVGYHQCNYCTNLLHASDAGTRRWDALFDRYGVDLVINGHNHSYERAHPKGSSVDTPAAQSYPSGAVVTPADGTVYVTAGAGGNERVEQSLYEPAMGSYVTVESGIRVPEVAHWSAARRLGPSSFLRVDVQAPADAPDGMTRMRVRAIEVADGVPMGVFDEVTIERTPAQR